MDKEIEAPHGFPVVGIGASSGGITALKRFFAEVPADSGMAFVVIVHLSKDHDSILAQILQTSAAIPVSQVTEPVKVEPNHVYVIPPAQHLGMSDGMILLTPREAVVGKRVPIDHFFTTLADAYGRDAYAVILSGAGSDGTLGIDRIKEQGGVALAQDPADAEFDSMPLSAIATGLIDVILPSDQLAAKIVGIYRSEPKEKPGKEDDTGTLVEILSVVRVRTGHDFSNYKRPTLLRRIARRQQVQELPDMKAYLGFLKDQPDEVKLLLRDLLITVTNFFRDGESFDHLEKHIIPNLFEGKGSHDSVRVWSCGCGTGEEAFSLAMLLHEQASRLADPPKIQVFASDINEGPIRTARDGFYSGAITTDVSPARLKRFFTPKNDGYLVNKSLRETVLFAPHNVLRDPPFSQMDLIACRNLLIYLNRETQAKVMALFGFALRPGGSLFLGSSEGVDGSESIFETVDKKHRIYAATRTQRKRPAPMMPLSEKWEAGALPGRADGLEPAPSISALHHRLAERYAPPSVLINCQYEAIHISERADRFLRFSGGEPTRDIFKMVHPALQLDLRAALMTACHDQQLAEVRNIKLELDGEPRSINLIVDPVETESPDPCYLVVFGDERQSAAVEPGKAVFETIAGDEAMGTVVRQLEEELRHFKERLRLTLEEGEVNTEELKAFNEELQATNEELRSATEEMETSREELQSVNEEVVSMNHELKEKVDEINRVNADLQNLMQSNDIGTIFLDRELKIKRYTRSAERLFNVIAGDIGRPFEHLTHRFDYRDLADDAAAVLETLIPAEREIFVHADHSTFLARILPYRTIDDRIDGVVISFLDISELKRTSEILQQREFLLGIAQEAAMAGVWTLDLQKGGAWWSEECTKLHGQLPGAVGMTMTNWIHRIHPDPEPVKSGIQQAIIDRTQYNHEFKIESPEGERWILEIGKASYDRAGEPLQMAGISLDVTERVQLRQEQSVLLARSESDQRKLRQADRRKDQFLATLAHELRNPLAPIRIGVEVLKHAASGSTEALKVIGIIERQTTQMVRLIDDLLDVSRITSGKLQLVTSVIDLRDVVTQAMEASQPLTVEAGHRVEVDLPDSPALVNGDAVRLVQVISNLINNAAKFTPARGKITISLVATKDEVALSVKDNGEGIAPDMQALVFDMFKQVDRPEGHLSKGLGIGLTLVRSLVSKHHGSIAVHSDGIGQGSKFTIRLPRVEQVPAPVSGNGGSPKDAAAKLLEIRKVLVVDDSPSVADVLAMFFQLEGFDVHTAYGGEAAVAACGEFQPDIVFMDVGMPGVDGNEAARRMRQAPGGTERVMVALTGWGQESDRIKSEAAGFNHHLTKPVSPQILREFLSAHP